MHVVTPTNDAACNLGAQCSSPFYGKSCNLAFCRKANHQIRRLKRRMLDRNTPEISMHGHEQVEFVPLGPQIDLSLYVNLYPHAFIHHKY